MPNTKYLAQATFRICMADHARERQLLTVSDVVFDAFVVFRLKSTPGLRSSAPVHRHTFGTDRPRERKTEGVLKGSLKERQW